MPVFCHFFHMQPSEFRRLRVRELDAFGKYMRDYAEAQRGR